MNLTCDKCGKPFTRRPSGVKEVNYCSRKCAYQSKTDKARARRTESEPLPITGARWLALNRGFALVDADRFDELNAFVWSRAGRDGMHAVRRKMVAESARDDEGPMETVFLHHAVLGVPSHVHIDHKDGNGLDCRKQNLRLADNSLNHANIGKMRGVYTSRYKGVYRDNRRKRWAAQIRIREYRTTIGRYETECEAAVAYDAAALFHFGEFAKTNFPWSLPPP
jgi:hypothetical protein